MSEDFLVTRLRNLVIMDEVGSDNPLGREAASAIERLTRDAQRLANGLLDADARAITAETALAKAQNKIDGLESDLDSAVEVAWNHGATKWVKMNYPAHFAKFNREDTEA